MALLLLVLMIAMCLAILGVVFLLTSPITGMSLAVLLVILVGGTLLVTHGWARRRPRRG